MPRVLVADDSLLSRQLLRRALELSGVPHDAIDTAHDGRAALDAARRTRYALVLLDLNMPELTGDDVLAGLRADPHAADTPVVIVSGDDLPGRVAGLRARGIAGFLSKPVRPEEVRDVARRAGVVAAAVAA